MATKTLILAFVALALMAVCALPTQRVIRSLELAAVVSKTTCPIKVEYNEDKNRVPRVIKMMKCENDTQHYCKNQDIPENECCLHYHNNHVMQCVEITDKVVVFFKNTNKTETVDVSVGCTCLIEKSTEAGTIS